MLIECSYCGAPLDVRPNELVTRCRYCNTSSQVQATRTVAQQTPPDWRPPRQWTPPAHVPADSARTLVYQATSAVVRLVRFAIGLAVLGVIVPVAVWLSAHQTKASAADVNSVLETAQQALSQAKQKAESLEQATAQENLFTGTAARDVVAKFSQKLGGKPVRARELVLYPEYAILEAQDPANPKHVDRYMYRNGQVGDPEPVSVQSIRGKLEDNLVSLDEVALDKLPALIANTLQQLAYEKAKVTHVIVERNLPFSKHVVMRVYASGPRESGRIDYTGTGQVLRVYK